MLLMEPTRSKRTQEKIFADAVTEAYQRHGFKSYRHAEQMTGVNYSTIYTIVSRGRIPTRGQVIEWAEGLGEDINKWLEFAGYEPISPELIKSKQAEEDTNLEPVKGIENVIAKYRIEGKLTPEKQERIMKYVREVIEDVDGQEDIAE